MTPHVAAPRRFAPALVLLLAGAALGALLAAGSGSSAHAQGASPGKTIAAIGIGQVAVKVDDRHKNASIVAGVEAAEAKAVPQAINEARDRATELAKAAGMTIGAVQAVEEQPQSPFGFYVGGPNAYPAPFGKDKYCGDERRPRFVRDSNGRRRVSGSRTVHVCRVPRFVVLNLSVTFAAT
jgi:hypothetical protein